MKTSRLHLLLAATLVGTPAAWAVPAGTVAFTTGDVTIRAAQGAARTATQGTAVESGETVETGRGRAQLRMVDGAYISLQPETTLRLDNYQNASTTAGESGLMSLLRGGLRTVTGLIGRTNRQNYRLTTPTATVGIRGTEFLATANDGTRVRVAGGIVALCTDAGCLDLTSGQTGFAPNGNTRPQIVSRAPSVPPQPAPETRFVAAEQRNGMGETLALGGESGSDFTTPLPNGNGGLGLVFSNSANKPSSAGLLGGTIAYDTQGRLVTFVDCCSPSTYLQNGTTADFGSDGIVAWGRWTAGTFGTGPALTSMHYFATTSTQSAAIPIVQAYASFASTAPTLTSSSTGAILSTGVANSVTGTLNVNFASGSGGTVSYLLNVPIAGQTFTINGTALQYSTVSFLGNSSTITSTGAGCSSTCVGNIPYGDAIQGTITGTGNTRAAANYGFSTTLGGGVSGTVVFKTP